MRVVAIGFVLAVLLVSPSIPRGSSALRSLTVSPRCPPPVGVFDGRAQLGLSVCGPTKVVPNGRYSYTVVLGNIKATTFRTVSLSLMHYDPITQASRPFRHAGAWVDPLMSVAVFPPIRNFGPGQTFRISFTLVFKRHIDPKGLNFVVEARASGPRAVAERTYDVWWN